MPKQKDLDSRAHHTLYLAYATGKGVKRDTDRAMKHLEEAARLGDAEAQNDLAHETYGQNHARALRLFLESARGGSANGALGAGRMLFYGRHAKRNETRGLALLERAASAKPPAAGAVDELAYARMRVDAACRTDEENLARAIADVGLGALRTPIQKASRGSVRLVTSRSPDTKIAKGATKIGGHPDLPRRHAWPHRAGKPLAFLAQINVTKPARGLLSFFYDAAEQPWGAQGEEEAWRVYLFEKRGLVRTPAPKPQLVQSACSVQTFDELTIPVARTALARSIAKKEEQYVAYCDLVRKFAHDYRRHPVGDGDVHRLFGHPDAIQGDLGRRIAYQLAGVDIEKPTPKLEAESARWQLLFQLDSDDRARMMWGDLGRLFFMIRDDDLVAGRFDRVFLQLQCG